MESPIIIVALASPKKTRIINTAINKPSRPDNITAFIATRVVLLSSDIISKVSALPFLSVSLVKICFNSFDISTTFPSRRLAIWTTKSESSRLST